MSSPAPFDLDPLRAALRPELELVRPLGEGTVARVFLAREPALKRLVAVKVLREEVAADEVARLRFEREAQAAASVSHPDVVAVYRVGRTDAGVPYMVMEYVEGRTLADVLAARGSLPFEEARRVLAATASALAAAHRKGVVHRDVRPGNIICEADTERIVLLDFGLAALLETGSRTVMRLTAAGERVGDPLRMSPEQLRGESATQQSDVYALGVLAYELLSGAGPFGPLSALEAAAAPLQREPIPLERLRDDVTPAFAGVIRRCLAPIPEQRPRAGEVFEALVRAPEPIARQPGQQSLARQSAEDLPLVRDFLHELERRKVGRVAIGYVAAGFLFLQSAQLIVPALPVAAPDRWYQAIVAVTLAGFPLALVLSWAFDVTASGVRRAAAAERAVGATPRRLLLPILALLLSTTAAIAAWLLLMR